MDGLASPLSAWCEVVTDVPSYLCLCSNSDVMSMCNQEVTKQSPCIFRPR